ncbi:MAG TPA: hypothetical protein VGW38_29575, partial [Chloroflexota bacterium]|nr:hypothetical protein [Chloroflexota bacterium]
MTTTTSPVPFQQRRIYVASSWRNQMQQGVVHTLRAAGHAVYDFKNPPGRAGFQWSAVDPNWQQWTPEEYRSALGHPVSQAGFASDWNAMVWADTGVLVMPCGRSAHIEAGYFVGAGKELHILLAEEQEPELMYLMATSISLNLDELLQCV